MDAARFTSPVLLSIDNPAGVAVNWPALAPPVNEGSGSGSDEQNGVA